MTFTPWKARGAAVSSALLLAAAFPPLNWWPLALVAMVPLLLAVWSRSAGRSKAFHALFLPSTTAKEAIGGGGLDIPGREAQGQEGLATDAVRERHRPEARAPVFWRGFRLGWLFGFVFFTATLWWIQHVTIAGMLALTAYLALYPALAMGLAGWLGLNPEAGWAANWGKAFLTATIWCGLEWVRSVTLWGFPWNGLAVPLFSMTGMRVPQVVILKDCIRSQALVTLNDHFIFHAAHRVWMRWHHHRPARRLGLSDLEQFRYAGPRRTRSGQLRVHGRHCKIRGYRRKESVCRRHPDQLGGWQVPNHSTSNR